MRNGECLNPEFELQIRELRQMTTGQLQLKYRDLFGQTSHSNHKKYLFRRVSWRLQALAQGELSERARRRAREIAQDADLRLVAPNKVAGGEAASATILVASASRRPDPRLPVPGTRLIKPYKNETHTVTVLENGFQYRDRLYKSLSAIAREVTGTQWNGYVFFGLSGAQEQPRAL